MYAHLSKKELSDQMVVFLVVFCLFVCLGVFFCPLAGGFQEGLLCVGGGWWSKIPKLIDKGHLKSKMLLSHIMNVTVNKEMEKIKYIPEI